MTLDPEDPRPPFQQVANALRAAILTKKFAPGDKLPSGAELARTYGVARGTVQDAMRVLRGEGLVVSRKGSGVFVRERTERPVALRPHIERAFEQAHVSIDFAGFSGETLQGAMQEPLDKIRAGRLTPESIAIRLLLPDPETPWGIPCDAGTLSDDLGVRQRMQRIMERHTQAIADSVSELSDLGLVSSAVTLIKVHGEPLPFKAYIINEDEVFFGFYPVVRHAVRIKGQSREIFDLMGKDAVLFHHASDGAPDSINTQYVEQIKMWFDSVWATVARNLETP
jgi:DNA-binding transcriptional regulator YhcF (GntR family)